MDLWKDRSWTPMLLNEIEEPFNSEEHIYEIKFDGLRALIFANTNEVKVYNRRKKEITNLYPELQNIKYLIKRNTIFDGEIVIMENGIPSFSKLQNRSHLKNKNKIKLHSKNNPVIFICFDILYDNKNLINLTLLNRKKILDKFKDNDYFIKSKYIDKKGIDLFNTIKKLNLEGIVAKRKKSPYEINKRSSFWLKIKNIKEEEFIICGYVEKESNYIISLVLGEYRNKDLYYVGRVTLAKKTSLYKQLKNEKIVKKSYLKDFYDQSINFIKPTLKCKVNYMERTLNNHLRQPFIKNNLH